MNNKGQAALEFLMTYGWTILAAMVSIAAFAQFGLVSTGTLTSITGATICVLPPGLACDYKIGSNGIQLVLTNGFHARIVDVSVRVISTEIGICNFPNPATNPKAIINVGESKHIFVICPDIGNAKRFKGDLEVSYRFEDQSITHTDTGTIRGSVEQGIICVDADNDGFGVGICETDIDCDDGDSAVYPNAPPENKEILCETCQDNKDNDCDTFFDSNDPQCDDACIGNPTCTPPDGDWDGYNDVVCGGLDCNDAVREIHPPETYESNVTMCQDEIDNDCDTTIDSIIMNPTNPDASCGGLGCGAGNDKDGDEHYALGSCIGQNVDDCDDNPDPGWCGSECHPGILGGERCNDSFDNDCNGIVNDGCICDNPSCDVDNDGYCSSQEPCNGNDCDDSNENINPGQFEHIFGNMCSDLIDNDCDTQVDCQDLCCQGIGGSSPIFSPLLKIDCAEGSPPCGGTG